MFDLHSFLPKIQMEAGHCFGSVQISSSLSGASRALMSMLSGVLASHRGLISLTRSVTDAPKAPECLCLMDYFLSWLQPVKPGSLPQAPSVLSMAPARPVVMVSGCWSRPKSKDLTQCAYLIMLIPPIHDIYCSKLNQLFSSCMVVNKKL